MSANSRKGYTAEHLAELWLEDELMAPLERPRAGAAQDRGDLIGLPITISVKNHQTSALSTWVDEMARMVAVNDHASGIVLHKRKGKGQPPDWYVTTSAGLFLPILRVYLQARGAIPVYRSGPAAGGPHDGPGGLP